MYLTDRASLIYMFKLRDSKPEARSRQRSQSVLSRLAASVRGHRSELHRAHRSRGDACGATGNLCRRGTDCKRARAQTAERGRRPHVAGWHLGYVNHTGAQHRIQVEINFLMRASALAPHVLSAASILDAQPCDFPAQMRGKFPGQVRE